MREIWFISLLVFACSPGFDEPYQVKDLRVLAIKADPPEFVFKTQEEAEKALENGLSVTFTMLLADPLGNGRNLMCTVRTCGLPSSGRCDDAEKVYTLQENLCKEGENNFSVMITPEFVQDALKADVAHGYFGIPVWFEFIINGGERQLYALKEVVVSLEFPIGRKPNQNPKIIGLNIDDRPVDGSHEHLFYRGEKIKIQLARTRSSKEPYILPSMKDPNQVNHLVEYMSIYFYSTSGTFSKSFVSDLVRNPFISEPEKVVDMSVIWQAPLDEDIMEVNFWFVLSDGRGGIDWFMIKGKIR